MDNELDLVPIEGFSPVAGIILIESFGRWCRPDRQWARSFSPVAGIILIESLPAETQTDKASGRQFS